MLRTECSGLNPVHKHGCIANGVYFTFSPSISSSHLIELMRHLIRDLFFVFPVHVKVLGVQIVPRHQGGTSVHQSFFHRGFCVVTSSVFLSARDFVKAVLFWDLRPSSFGTSKQCVNPTISLPAPQPPLAPLHVLFSGESSICWHFFHESFLSLHLSSYCQA